MSIDKEIERISQCIDNGTDIDRRDTIKLLAAYRYLAEETGRIRLEAQGQISEARKYWGECEDQNRQMREELKELKAFIRETIGQLTVHEVDEKTRIAIMQVLEKARTGSLCE